MQPIRQWEASQSPWVTSDQSEFCQQEVQHDAAYGYTDSNRKVEALSSIDPERSKHISQATDTKPHSCVSRKAHQLKDKAVQVSKAVPGSDPQNYTPDQLSNEKACIIAAELLGVADEMVAMLDKCDSNSKEMLQRRIGNVYKSLKFFISMVSQRTLHRSELLMDLASIALENETFASSGETSTVQQCLKEAATDLTYSSIIQLDESPDDRLMLSRLEHLQKIINVHSIRLPDENLYRLHYSLAVRYIHCREFDKARESIKEACKWRKPERLPEYLNCIDILAHYLPGSTNSQSFQMDINSLPALTDKHRNMDKQWLIKHATELNEAADALIRRGEGKVFSAFTKRIQFDYLPKFSYDDWFTAYNYLNSVVNVVFWRAMDGSEAEDFIAAATLLKNTLMIIRSFPRHTGISGLNDSLLKSAELLLKRKFITEDNEKRIELLKILDECDIEPVKEELYIQGSQIYWHLKDYHQAMRVLEECPTRGTRYLAQKAIIHQSMGELREAFAWLAFAKASLTESSTDQEHYYYHKRKAYFMREILALPHDERPIILQADDISIRENALYHARKAQRFSDKPETRAKLDGLISKLKELP